MFSTAAGAPQDAASAGQSPKPPVSAMTYRDSQAVVPTPLAERIRRGVVPKRGSVSGIDGGTLISGDGIFMVEQPA